MLKINERNWHSWLIPLLSGAVLLAALLLFFPFDSGYLTVRDPLGLALWTTWTTQSPDAQDYAYCLFVPIIVAGIIYDRRDLLARTPIRGNNAGIFWIIVGLLLFWIGSRAGKQYIGCTAIQLLLAGLVVWFWGGPMFRRLLFVWALLIFAWPLPFIDSTIAFPLRIIVSNLAYHTLNFIGISCIRDGTALNSAPNPAAGLQFGDRFQIDVADPCSGLHSLLPLMMFSACFGYFFLTYRWQQWAIFLSAIPFAVIANVVRILMLVIGCLLFGSPFAMGTFEKPSWYHEGCGFFVFVVALGLECALGFLLVKIQRRYFAGASNAPSTPPPSPTGTVATWRSWTVLGLAGVMAIVAWNHPPPYLSPKAGVVTTLPKDVKASHPPGGHFFAFDTPVSPEEREILPKDTEFARKIYDDFHGHKILFSIVLSGLQQYNIHPPQVCLVAQGWSIVGEENVDVPLASGRTLTVRNLSIQREGRSEDNQHVFLHAYYMYWYVTDGISTPSASSRNWQGSVDRVVHNRAHRWAYVIAMSPITESLGSGGLNAAQTKAMLIDFIRQIVPSVQKSEMTGLTEN